jgi:hypothetical protein
MFAILEIEGYDADITSVLCHKMLWEIEANKITILKNLVR